MDLFGENHADAIVGAQHWGQGYTCFFSLIQTVDFCKHPKLWILVKDFIFLFVYLHSFIFLWFLICFQLFSLTNSLSSGQHCLLISIPTCPKLTFPPWRLNLAVLARIDLLIIFERCLQEVKSSHLFQCEMGNNCKLCFQSDCCLHCNLS